ncbi:MAG: ribosomal protein L7/L12 [Alphaproteobacteria bacterium]
MSITELLNAVGGLTYAEAAELEMACERQKAALVAAQAPGTAVVLTAVNRAWFVAALKEIRALSGLSLKEAKDIFESVERGGEYIFTGHLPIALTDVVACLQQAGCTAIIR